MGLLTPAVVPHGHDITAGLSPEALAALPALRTKDYLFEQPEIRSKVGETVVLRLDNVDSSTHFLDIEEFNVHTPMPAGRSSMAIFTPTQPGTFTFYCHSHADGRYRHGRYADRRAVGESCGRERRRIRHPPTRSGVRSRCRS